MDSNCDKIKDEVLDLVTGVLGESHRESLRDHLADCECCRAYARSLSEEEHSLGVLFGDFERAILKGEEAVIRAIDGIEMCGGLGFDSIGHLAKHGFAAAVIVVATIYFAVTLNWICQITAYIRQSM